MRGEYCLKRSKMENLIGSPPLARGIRCPALAGPSPLRITPACAGNTREIMKLFYAQWDHPRLRGEYDVVTPMLPCVLGSPPLARGIPKIKRRQARICRITPACAGNTIFEIKIWIPARDHPRLRGEYYDAEANVLSQVGSPPLARGIRLPYLQSRGRPWITPACAGNTALRKRLANDIWDHPRLRGEYSLLCLS